MIQTRPANSIQRPTISQRTSYHNNLASFGLLESINKQLKTTRRPYISTMINSINFYQRSSKNDRISSLLIMNTCILSHAQTTFHSCFHDSRESFLSGHHNTIHIIQYSLLRTISQSAFKGHLIFFVQLLSTASHVSSVYWIVSIHLLTKEESSACRISLSSIPDRRTIFHSSVRYLKNDFYPWTTYPK